MTKIYTYSGRTIKANKSWSDDDGIVHPKTWSLWSEKDKAAKGIVEVVPPTLQPLADRRLYITSHNADGSANAKAKDISDVRAEIHSTIASSLASFLNTTDWNYIRKADTGTAVSSAVQTWRNKLRAEAKTMEDAVNAASNVEAVATLFSNGTLYTWTSYEDIVAEEKATAEKAAAEKAAAEKAAAEKAAAEKAAAEKAAAEAE